MRRSESVKATYDGVVRLPWSLAMISGRRRQHQYQQDQYTWSEARFVRTNTVVLPYTDAGICGAEIDTNGFGHGECCCRICGRGVRYVEKRGSVERSKRVTFSRWVFIRMPSLAEFAGTLENALESSRSIGANADRS
jgi:hypothetical protein